MNYNDYGIFIREMQLPMHIKGVTIPNGDGTFDVYINASLSETQKRTTLRHELRHIKLDHFFKPTETVALAEKCANSIS